MHASMRCLQVQNQYCAFDHKLNYFRIVGRFVARRGYKWLNAEEFRPRFTVNQSHSLSQKFSKKSCLRILPKEYISLKMSRHSATCFKMEKKLKAKRGDEGGWKASSEFQAPCVLGTDAIVLTGR